ncbi:hypothetical protein EMA8858_03808 [Emticicia aquatica]|uniref:Uncharacterized protein n=1 Tax=Emticicia aquatica TaxID=1681835 RepID=A0ABN8F1F9_9BACT|nr:hypothetical protein [Emticicia aquatica]CAH0997674.1 hypothetical protein EMA8858_03808 [Emticicia aquatica]
MKANKFYLLILVVFLFQFGGFSSFAQVGIKLGTGTTFGTKTPSAVLDLGTGIQGLLLPKVALTSKTSQSPLVGASFAAAAPAGMTVYNTATAGTSPNNVTAGIYYSDGMKWNRNEEIFASNGLIKDVENIELGGSLTKHTTIEENGFNFILKPSTTASGMTFAAGNNTANNRIYMPSDGLEIQSNEVTPSTKPIIQVMNSTNEKFRVQSDGKVGIGTETPTNLLHINGGAEGVETVLLNLQVNAGSAVTSGTGAAIRLSPTNAINERGVELAAVNQGANAIDLVFRTTSAVNNFLERMKITSTGQVGINTNPTNIVSTSTVQSPGPTSILHVNGTIAVTTGATTANSVILSSTNVTLPTASTCSGRIYMIRNTGTVAISVTSIIAYNSTTPAVYSLSAVEGAITVVSNGTNWYRIQ